MCKIDYHDVKTPETCPCEDLTLVKKPLDISSGKEYEKCRYAFFPDRQLCADEPEIVGVRAGNAHLEVLAPQHEA